MGRPGVPCLISIHAPREGSDLIDQEQGNVLNEFLSTLPARGATCIFKNLVNIVSFLSTLPARGATFGAFFAGF